MIDYYVQEIYLMRLSSQLERFRAQRKGLWNCRCPFCGDSAKNKYKTRGYFFEHEGSIIYKCHNCEHSSGLINVIKELNYELYKDMMIEVYKDKNHQNNEKHNSDDKSRNLIKNTIKSINELSYIKKIVPGTEWHDYLEARCMPSSAYQQFYGVPNISKFGTQFEKYANSQFPSSPGILIPYYGRDGISFLQVRNIDPDCGKYRYFTLQIGEGDKIFNLDRIDTSRGVTILEGAFDSVFIDNAVACAGIPTAHAGELLREMGVKFIRYAYDADYKTNPHIRKQLERRINEGYHVVLYDSDFRVKDVNDAIINQEYTIDEINSYFNTHTYQGLQASLQLAKKT